LVEILIVEHANDAAMIGPRSPVFGHSDQLGDIAIRVAHIAGQSDHWPACAPSATATVAH
jgi:hypothetical protein